MLKRKPATASGGEQQRVALGRSLIQRPRILLLDEPLTNLDAKLRHDMRAEFKRLHREFGITIVYATPDELEALSMGDEIAVMRQGRVVQIGSPDDLYDRPRDVYVATKIGAPAMNIIAAKRGRDGAAIELPFGEVRADPHEVAWAGGGRAAAAGDAVPVRRPPVRRARVAGGRLFRRGAAGRAARRPHRRRHPCRRRRPEARSAGGRRRLAFATAIGLTSAFDAARAHLFRPGDGAALG